MKPAEHLHFMDAAALTICLLYSVGKIGCFLAGHNTECSGSASDLPWSLSLPNLQGTYHPRQLYDSLFHLFLFFVLLFVYKRKLKFHGEIILIYFIFSQIYCFLSEYLSYNPKVAFGLTSGQIVNALIFIIGVSFVCYKYKRYKAELLIDK